VVEGERAMTLCAGAATQRGDAMMAGEKEEEKKNMMVVMLILTGMVRG